MIELTAQQQQALAGSQESPPRVLGPVIRQTYALLPAELYEQMKGLLEDDFDPREAYPFVDRVMAEDDAADPTLESYQQTQRGS